MQFVPAETLSTNTLQVADTTSVSADSLEISSPAGVITEDSTTFSQTFVDAGTLMYEGRFSEAWQAITIDFAGRITDFAPRIAATLIVFIIFYTAYRILYKLLRRILNRNNVVQLGLKTLALQAFRLLSIVLIGIIVLQTLGINPAALITGIGVAGIAFGFAARDTVENILSGVNILTDKAFRIGDTLIVGDIYCTVEDITLRTTRLRTPKNEVLIIPNQQMANQRILNHSIAEDLRIEIPFSIAYKEYPQQARKVILELTQDDTRLLETPKPSVVVIGLNDSSVDLSLWVYVANPREERQIIYYYTEAIKEALNRAGIEIPFPHIQLIQS